MVSMAQKILSGGVMLSGFIFIILLSISNGLRNSDDPKDSNNLEAQNNLTYAGLFFLLVFVLSSLGMFGTEMATLADVGVNRPKTGGVVAVISTILMVSSFALLCGSIGMRSQYPNDVEVIDSANQMNNAALILFLIYFITGLIVAGSRMVEKRSVQNRSFQSTYGRRHKSKH